MSVRIKRILLVCNNYDSFTLEEDGRIDVQIAQEYAELNLSNPPLIVRKETGAAALELVESGEEFDLTILMQNSDIEKIQQFAQDMKRLAPRTPLVLLTSFSKNIYGQLNNIMCSAGTIRPT